MFNKILFPVESSDLSHRVYQTLKEISEKYNSEILILHGYENPDINYGHPTATFSYNNLRNEIESNLVEEGKSILNKVKKEIESFGIKTTTILKKGDIKSLIIECITSESCDLVIMSSRGNKKIKNLLLGSVSNYVLHHTKCPVFLIH